MLSVAAQSGNEVALSVAPLDNIHAEADNLAGTTQAVPSQHPLVRDAPQIVQPE